MSFSTKNIAMAAVAILFSAVSVSAAPLANPDNVAEQNAAIGNGGFAAAGGAPYVNNGGYYPSNGGYYNNGGYYPSNGGYGQPGYAVGGGYPGGYYPEGSGYYSNPYPVYPANGGETINQNQQTQDLQQAECDGVNVLSCNQSKKTNNGGLLDLGIL